MNKYNLTVEQVRNEILSLVEQYPDRRGGVPMDDYDEFSCVYYTDEIGTPVSLTHFNPEDPSYEEPQLVEPVCIIGQWIESFHPEFKQDEVIYDILIRNSIMSNLNVEDTPFTAEVLDLLSNAQSVQDSYSSHWSDIPAAITG